MLAVTAKTENSFGRLYISNYILPQRALLWTKPIRCTCDVLVAIYHRTIVTKTKGFFIVPKVPMCQV